MRRHSSDTHAPPGNGQNTHQKDCKAHKTRPPACSDASLQRPTPRDNSLTPLNSKPAAVSNANRSRERLNGGTAKTRKKRTVNHTKHTRPSILTLVCNTLHPRTTSYSLRTHTRPIQRRQYHGGSKKVKNTVKRPLLPPSPRDANASGRALDGALHPASNPR